MSTHTCTCGHLKAEHGERFAGKGRVRTLADACLVCPCEIFVDAARKSDKMDAELSAALLEFDRIEREHKKLGDRLGAIKGVLKSKLMSQA